MNQKIPHSPFTTRLSGSAKETELRIRNIFQWKKKRPPVILFILTVVVLFSCFGLVSCQMENTEPPADDPIADVTIEENPQQNVAPAFDLSQEPPLHEADLALAVPDFLTEEQQLLYRKARSLYEHAFGADTSFIEYPETVNSSFAEYETLERNNHIYTRSQGRYSCWALFDAVIHSAFTDSFFRFKNAENLYIEHNGYLYFVNAARGCGYYYNDNFPDKFRLIAQTDTSIEFVVIGHYSEAWPKDGETTEERNCRLEREYEYTWEFPIIMVLTEHGWRFDQFYSPLTDEVGPENAVERASNNTSAMELFQSVLTGSEFINADSGAPLTLEQLRQRGFSDNDTYPAIPEKFAAVDMDHDGTTEVVLQLKIGAVAHFLILHVQNETVYGYSAGLRSLRDLKTDGTFEWSGGAFDCGSASIRFTEYFYTFNGVTYREPYTTDKITYCDSRSDPDGKQLFFVDGESATADEFDTAISAQHAKPSVTWYDFTDDNIKTLFID